MTDLIRILIPSDDQSAQAIIDALQSAVEICKKRSLTEIILYVPGKDNIQHSTISAALGDTAAKTLYDGNKLPLIDEISIYAKTMKTFSWATNPSVLISVYSDQKMLDHIESKKNNLLGIIAIPHAEDALSQWQKTWSPMIHGSTNQPSSTPLVQDQVIEEALSSITNGINYSSSALHPSDKKIIEEVLKILRINDHFEAPQNIRAWAIKRGWHHKTANQLEVQAQKYLFLESKPKISNPELATQRYNRWKEAIKKPSST